MRDTPRELCSNMSHFHKTRMKSTKQRNYTGKGEKRAPTVRDYHRKEKVTQLRGYGRVTNACTQPRTQHPETKKIPSFLKTQQYTQGTEYQGGKLRYQEKVKIIELLYCSSPSASGDELP